MVAEVLKVMLNFVVASVRNLEKSAGGGGSAVQFTSLHGTQPYIRRGTVKREEQILSGKNEHRDMIMGPVQLCSN